MLLTLLVATSLVATDPPPPLLSADPPPPLPVVATNAVGGRVFRIPLGLAFESIASALRPGDEVVLERGVHMPFTLTDLRGEPGKPIVIRGESGEEPARFPYIKATDRGITLVRPRNVVLRDLMVGNGTGTLVRIVGERAEGGEPWDANVQVRSLRVMQTNPEPEQVGMELRDVARVDVSDMQFLGWNRSAVRLVGSNRCSLNLCVLDPVKGLPQRTGVQVLQGCSQLAMSLLTFGPGVGTAFELGACEGAATDVAPASNLLVSRCSVPEAGVFAQLGSVENVLLQWNTATDLRRTVWGVPPDCGLPNGVTLADNLFTWTPGMIERISEVPEGLPAESVRLQANLWWSPEIPAAFEAIGRPFGVELAPQVFDVDPKVEARFGSPVEAKAAAFGWRAEPPKPAAPPSTTDGADRPPPSAAPPPQG
jgi:hypothetical protein